MQDLPDLDRERKSLLGNRIDGAESRFREKSDKSNPRLLGSLTGTEERLGMERLAEGGETQSRRRKSVRRSGVGGEEEKSVGWREPGEKSR